jgi:hypothetical protein
MKVFRFVPSPSVNRKHAAPVPAKTTVPDWYKHAERFYHDKHGIEYPGLKVCVPFIDAMISGFMLVTPVDVHVNINDKGESQLNWEEVGFHILTERVGLSGSTIPRPPGYAHNHLAWNCQWGWKVPEGYSVLLTHPLNRTDLPFYTLSGIVDSEEFTGWGNVPFFIKEGWEGVIPAGTPIAQLLPIKQDKWVSVQDYTETPRQLKRSAILRSATGVYKKMWRKPKEYSAMKEGLDVQEEETN